MLGRIFVGKVAMALTVVALFVGWIVLLVALVPLLSLVGVSEQVAAGIASALFFVGFWAVGLKLLFGGSAGKETVTAEDHKEHAGEADESSTEQLRHNWWHVIAFVAVAVVATTAINHLFLAVAEPHQLLYLPVFLGALPSLLVFLSVALPFAFYFDTKYVRATNDEWEPSSRIYGGVGALLMVGVIVLRPSPMLILCAVPCGWYLYQRHVHLGVPAIVSVLTASDRSGTELRQ